MFRSKAGRRADRRVSIFLLLALGLGLSVVAYLVVRNWERARIKGEFTRRAALRASMLQRSINSYLEILYAMTPLFAVKGEVTSEVFEQFARNFLTRHRDIQALEWIVRVADGERADFEARMSRQLSASFEITEVGAAGKLRRAGKKEEYFPVRFSAALRGAVAPGGYDVSSNAASGRALKRARGTGAVSMSRIVLDAANAADFGFRAFLPVYDENPSGKPAGENLRGFLTIVFSITSLLNASMRGLDVGDVVIHLYDGDPEQGERPLFFCSVRGGTVQVQAVEEETPGSMNWVTMLEAGGRSWLIRCYPTPEFMSALKGYPPWAVFVIGVLVTGLMAEYKNRVVITARMAAELARSNEELKQQIAERVRAEAEVRRLNENLERRVLERTQELQAATRELEGFCYSVSHDLQAPARRIEGFSNALLASHGDRLDVTGQEYLNYIRASARNMWHLIEDLLNLSRTAQHELQREEVDMSFLARAVYGELQRTNPDRKVEVVVQPGLTAYGDSHLLQLVLENLLGNAWKFTAKQPHARIEVGVTHALPPGAFGPFGSDTSPSLGDKPIFFVRDNGVGFDMRYGHRLFSPFQRLHADSEYQGTGIGLATVQRIIFRHGGRVWAYAEEGKGATFYFTL